MRPPAAHSLPHTVSRPPAHSSAQCVLHKRLSTGSPISAPHYLAPGHFAAPRRARPAPHQARVAPTCSGRPQSLKSKAARRSFSQSESALRCRLALFVEIGGRFTLYEGETVLAARAAAHHSANWIFRRQFWVAEMRLKLKKMELRGGKGNAGKRAPFAVWTRARD